MKGKCFVAILILLGIFFSGCSEQNQMRTITEEDKRNAVWLNREKPEDFLEEAKKVADAQVVISKKLNRAMRWRSDDAVFAVAICFAPMVSEEMVNQLTGIEETLYLQEVYQKASEAPEEIGMMTRFAGGTCEIYRFFYAYGTEEQIRNLTCEEGCSLYIAATYQYK